MNRLSRLAIAALLLLASRPGIADTSQQVWPGLEGHFELSPRARAVLAAGSVRADQAGVGAGRAAVTDVQLEGFFDLMLKRRVLVDPFGRPHAEWERDHYVWARIGYHYGVSLGEDTSVNEHRGLMQVSGQVPLPAGFQAVNRARVERRDVDGSLSTRYRDRLAFERETRIAGVVTVPYARTEAFYDSRYDSWSRWLYEAGVEIALGGRWRLEPYLALQDDSEPERKRVGALGITLKFYRRSPAAPSPGE